MQEVHTPKKGEHARVSRRKFMEFALAGSAATLPVVALAEASGKTSRLPQSLKHQLDACIAQLEQILLKMHPGCDDFRGGYHAWAGGGASVIIEAGPRDKWEGEGIYLVQDYHKRRIDGQFHVARKWSDMSQRHYLWGRYLSAGHLSESGEVIEPARLVAKLRGWNA